MGALDALVRGSIARGQENATAAAGQQEAMAELSRASREVAETARRLEGVAARFVV
jgi:hypothetical protein